jgi:hypothetical protein
MIPVKRVVEMEDHLYLLHFTVENVEQVEANLMVMRAKVMGQMEREMKMRIYWMMNLKKSRRLKRKKRSLKETKAGSKGVVKKRKERGRNKPLKQDRNRGRS